MPDIQMRFHKDMLVLSAPIDALLARQGIDAARDRQYLNLMEPDSISDALKLEAAAGAQCVVAATEDITQARLAHLNMDANVPRLALAALAAAGEAKPQHLLVEIGPCGLPLDAASKASLNENRAQYADAARAFEDGTFDAFFLNGFTRIADLKCALMGVAQVSDKPVFASMTIWATKAAGADDDALSARLGGSASPATLAAGAVGGADSSVQADSVENALPTYLPDGYAALDIPAPPPLPAAKRTMLDPALWPEALDAMVDLGAAVVGFETSDSIQKAIEYAHAAVDRTNLPVLAQLCVTQPPSASARSKLVPLDAIDDYTPDTMATSAVKLFGAGVQFLRATGLATPAYTGALAATVQGLDVHRG